MTTLSSMHPSMIVIRAVSVSVQFSRGPCSLLPPATKLGQGYVFTGVCDSVHGGGVCLSACWDTTPLGPEHAGRYGQRAGFTHPTGMQSCLT